MAVTEVNMFLQRYMTVPIVVSCYLPDYTPFPLAGCDIIWTVNSGAGAIITKSTALATITTAVNTLSFTISAAETLLLPYGDLDTGINHEAKLQTAAGQVFPIMVGNIRTAPSLITSF